MAAQLAACSSTLACGPSGSDGISSSSRPQTAGSAPTDSSAAGEAGGGEAAASTADGLTEAADPPGIATAAAAPASPLPAATPSWDATHASSAAAAAAASRARAAQYEQDVAALYASIDRLLDAATAHLLVRSSTTRWRLMSTRPPSLAL